MMDREIINIQNCGCKINYNAENNKIDFIFQGSSPENFKKTLFETFEIESVHISKSDWGITYGIDVEHNSRVLDAVVRLQS